MCFKVKASLPSPRRDLDCLGAKNRALVALPIEEVLQTLNDLITYFQLPDAELEHEEKQIKLRSLKNRQNLFKQEVSVYTAAGKELYWQYAKKVAL